MLGEREEVKPQVRRMGMQKHGGFFRRERHSPGLSKACSHTHVQEDTHVCTPSQGPVLTREVASFPGWRRRRRKAMPSPGPSLPLRPPGQRAHLHRAAVSTAG